MFGRLVSVRLGRFMERSGVLPTTLFADRNGLGTCHALLCLSYILQSALESGQENIIVQNDCSAAFDRVNHHEFSVSSVLWVLEVNLVNIDCLYQIDHSMLW